jgi:hypothetical protein
VQLKELHLTHQRTFGTLEFLVDLTIYVADVILSSERALLRVGEVPDTEVLVTTPPCVAGVACRVLTVTASTRPKSPLQQLLGIWEALY